MTIPSRRGMPAGRCRQPAWRPRRLLARITACDGGRTWRADRHGLTGV